MKEPYISWEIPIHLQIPLNRLAEFVKLLDEFDKAGMIKSDILVYLRKEIDNANKKSKDFRETFFEITGHAL